MNNLKCGIEIHQRLASREKLFCACANALAEDERPSGTLRRKLRAVAGELGEVDPAAAFEAARSRGFNYQLFSNTCLVEEDEEPPHALNEEALEIAVQVALLLGARVLDEVHVMRKTVVDGSAVSGFQRTALVAVDGRLKTSFGEVRIPSICLEEESAGIVAQEGKVATYSLDRLGMPLVEIATDASLSSGKQAREAAEAIGLLLRSTRRVQRGLGSIRQDLNVSVDGGSRCEVKGVQELDALEKIVENEASRQRWLLWIMQELQKRGVKKSSCAVKSVAKIFGATGCAIIRNALSKGHAVMAAKLAGFAGLLGRELMPGHRFGTELSDYAKAAAGVQGIFHSDEDLGKYGFSEAEKRMAANALGCTKEDAWVLCAAPELQAVEALAAAFGRAMAAFGGVPKETRKAEGGLTKFMRPLPGASRMYPETDVPPVVFAREFLALAAEKLPPSRNAVIGKYMKLGLQKEVAAELFASEHAGLFEKIIANSGVDAVFVASVLLQSLKALAREGVAVDAVGGAQLLELFKLLGAGKIVKAAVPDVLRGLASGKACRQAIEEKQLWRLPAGKIAEIAKGKASFEEIMREYRLVASPGDVRASVLRSTALQSKHANSGVLRRKQRI